MDNLHAINWLKKRFEKTANVKYLNTRSQLEHHFEIEKCFNKFDEDHSGTLSITEIYEMLKSVGLIIKKSLNKFILSDQGNKTFKEIVQKQCRSQERNETDGDVSYIPHDFKSMLEFISWKISREQCTKGIEDDDILKNAMNFQNLFKLSDMNANVSSKAESRALKLMFHEAKRRVNSSHCAMKIDKETIVQPKRFSNIINLKKEEQKLKQLIENAKIRGKSQAEEEWKNKQGAYPAIKNKQFSHRLVDKQTKRNVPFALRNTERILRLKSANYSKEKRMKINNSKRESEKPHATAIQYESCQFSERSVEGNPVLRQMQDAKSGSFMNIVSKPLNSHKNVLGHDVIDEFWGTNQQSQKISNLLPKYTNPSYTSLVNTKSNIYDSHFQGKENVDSNFRENVRPVTSHLGMHNQMGNCNKIVKVLPNGKSLSKSKDSSQQSCLAMKMPRRYKRFDIC